MARKVGVEAKVCPGDHSNVAMVGCSTSRRRSSAMTAATLTAAAVAVGWIFDRQMRAVESNGRMVSKWPRYHCPPVDQWREIKRSCRFNLLVKYIPFKNNYLRKKQF